MAAAAIIFYGSALFGLAAGGLGALGRPAWYWWAALAAYVCSFMSGFSIGLYLLSAAFVFLSLALGHSLRLIRRRRHALLAVALGLALWSVAVFSVDDYWLFLPFKLLDPWLSSGGVRGGGSGVCVWENGVLRCTRLR